MSIENLSPAQLRQAASIKDEIINLQSELSRLMIGHTVPMPAAKKRTMSASARAKIAAAQRARWAKVKAGK